MGTDSGGGESELPPLHVRLYGEAGPVVFVLHGGPAAAGNAAPIARGLSESFRAIEPFQRGSGDEPLTVARHVADLDALVRATDSPGRPAVVGESWGAMLALAYATAHPEALSALVLVGCGTFDPASRARMHELIAQRRASACDAYDYDAEPAEDLALPFDERAHSETWNDMLEAQARGVYPAAFAAIDLPVLMIHGVYDPHPGQMIHRVLEQYLPRIEYHELADCGHSPWLERRASAAFFAKLSAWLGEHAGRAV